MRTGIYVSGSTLAVLALVLAPGAGPAVAATSLQVLSSLAEVAAGVALLGCWRIGGRGLVGWLGVALVDRGVLSVAHHSIDTLRIGPVNTIEPFGRLVVCVIVAACVYAAVRTPEVDSAFRPLRTILASAVFGLVVMVALDRAVADVETLRTSPVFQQASVGACAAVWLVVATVAFGSLRRGDRVTRLWAGSYALLLGTSAGVEATVALTPWARVGERFGLFVAACLILVAAAWELRCTAQNQDRYALTLRVALTHSEAAMERERSQLDERLHDLRNAVSALRSADHTLRRYAGRLDAESKNRLADALTSELSRLQTLIEPARHHTIERVLLANALEPVLVAERTFGSTIVADLPPTRVLCDPDALAQVVQNLLANCRKHAPGSPITVSAAWSQNRMVIRVSDRGPGIPQAERDVVFERGQRGSTSAGTQGSGIGLYTASTLMAAMGGSLTVGDTDVGTTFVIELPVQIISLTTSTTFTAPYETGQLPAVVHN